MFAFKIKELYTRLNLTQQEFADEIGYTQQAISKIINNRSSPSTRLLQAIYHRFPQVNPKWLEEDNNNEPMFLEILQTEIQPPLPLCQADGVCKQICELCQVLPPDDKKSVLMLIEILKSYDNETILAIKQNIKQFRKLIEQTDFKTPKGLRGRKA